MGSYIVIADISNAIDARTLIAITDDTQSGAKDDDIINAAIDRAEGWFNAGVERRYSTPIVSPGGDVEDMCIQKTILILYARKGTLPDYWKNIGRDLEEKLLKISSGEIWLSGVKTEKPLPAVDSQINDGDYDCNIWDSGRSDYLGGF